MIKNDEIDLIINTTEGKRAIRESHSIRREGGAAPGHLLHDGQLRRTRPSPRSTTLEDHDVNRLQDLHRELGAA
jgi:carbamoyl-phosphate synthase large subunit